LLKKGVHVRKRGDGLEIVTIGPIADISCCKWQPGLSVCLSLTSSLCMYAFLFLLTLFYKQWPRKSFCLSFSLFLVLNNSSFYSSPYFFTSSLTHTTARKWIEHQNWTRQLSLLAQQHRAKGFLYFYPSQENVSGKNL
jgi:hypothetical protein